MASDTSAGPLDVDEVHALVDRVLRVFNGKDVDAFVAVMAPDVVFDHVASPTPIEGREAVGAFYGQGIWPALSDMRLELLDGPFLHPTEPRFMVAWRFSGVHTGRLDPPGLDPTGRTVDAVLHERGELRGGLVQRLVIVFDVATMMRQLGVLPAQATAAERLMLAGQNLRVRTGRLLGRR